MSNEKQALEATSIMVLEDWALMLVDPATSKKIDTSGEPLYCSRIKFKGTGKGEICIVADKDFIKMLASNVLGTDDSVQEETIFDAFAEMANVVAGNFLTEAYGADKLFDLTPPVTAEAADDIVETCSKTDSSIYLNADSCPVSIHLLKD